MGAVCSSKSKVKQFKNPALEVNTKQGHRSKSNLFAGYAPNPEKTEQKSDCIKTAKSYELNYETLNRLSDPVLIIDGHSRKIVYMNIAAKKRVGNDFLGRDFEVLIPIEHRKSHESYYQRFISDKAYRNSLTKLNREGIRMGGRLVHRIPFVMKPIGLDVPIIVPVEIHLTQIESGFSIQIIEKSDIVEMQKAQIKNQKSIAHEGRNVMNAAIDSIRKAIDLTKKSILEIESMLLQKLHFKIRNQLNDLLSDNKKKLYALENSLYSEMYASVVQNYILNKSQQEIFNPCDWVNSMIGLFEEECANKHIRIERQGALINKINYIIESHKCVLIYSFVNVLKNAIKYISLLRENHFIKIYLQINQDSLILSIIDNGLGMTTEQCGLCFEEGTKFNIHIADSDGSGLPNINRALNEVNSSISVQSEFNKGSIFKIEMPLKVIETYRIEEKRVAIDFSLMQVLIVDDVELNNKILRNRLKQIGFIDENIRQASSREDALILYKDNIESLNPFHIILTDLNMPEKNTFDLNRPDYRSDMSGMNLVSEIRQYENENNLYPTYISLLSGSPLDHDIKTKNLFNSLLLKPLDINAIRSSILPHVEESNKRYNEYRHKMLLEFLSNNLNTASKAIRIIEDYTK